MKINVRAMVHADLDSVWSAWNNPADIKRWNAASEDWHTVSSTVDLRNGGSFSSRMEARDGSAGFDFSGSYTKVKEKTLIEYRLEDGRTVTVRFSTTEEGVLVEEEFDPDTQFPSDQQQAGWQSILDNFARFVEKTKL